MSASVKLPPEAERRAALKALIDAGIEPSPENLLKASRKRGAPLYQYFRSLPEKDWAEFGKYETARKIIRSTHVEYSVGGATISVRQVECVRVGGEKRYAAMDAILQDGTLTDAYMAEIQSLLGQASDKLDRLRSLMSDQKQGQTKLRKVG